MSKSIVPVLAGYLVFAASAALLFGVSGRDPHQRPDLPFLAGALIYVAMCSVLAGFVSSRFAKPVPSERPAVTLAAIIAVAAMVSMAAKWHAGSVWSEASVILVSAPAVFIGGRWGASRPDGNRDTATDSRERR